MEQEFWGPRRARQDAKSQGTHFLLLRGPGLEHRGHATAGTKPLGVQAGPRCRLLGPLVTTGTTWVGGELGWSQDPKFRCLWGLARQITEAHGMGGDGGRPERMCLVRGVVTIECS